MAQIGVGYCHSESDGAGLDSGGSQDRERVTVLGALVAEPYLVDAE